MSPHTDIENGHSKLPFLMAVEVVNAALDFNVFSLYDLEPKLMNPVSQWVKSLFETFLEIFFESGHSVPFYHLPAYPI